jgi:hypothetical protein
VLPALNLNVLIHNSHNSVAPMSHTDGENYIQVQAELVGGTQIQVEGMERGDNFAPPQVAVAEDNINPLAFRKKDRSCCCIADFWD